MSDRIEHGKITAFDRATGAGFVQPDFPRALPLGFYVAPNEPCRAVAGDRVTYVAKRSEGKRRALYAFDIRPEKSP
jgi:cold shock CspA family protein